MKCQCERCKGTGSIVCPNCNGKGRVDLRIEYLEVPENHPKRVELLALISDKNRAMTQARALAELNPARRESYDLQLCAVLEELTDQAGRLMRST